MSHVFISYSKKNKDYARKLADHLLSQGFAVWIDDQIEPSDEWFKRIVKSIRECAAFLVIMTPESGASRWVEREVMLADELQKPMFPVLLDGDLHTCELWALFFGKQYEDARGDRLPGDRFYTKLALSAPRKAVTPPSQATLEDDDLYTPTAMELALREAMDNRDSMPASITKLSSAIELASAQSEDDDDSHIPTAMELALREAMDSKVASRDRLEKRRQEPDVSAILPSPFEWCDIPLGKVTIEYSDTDHKTFDVPHFWMAKYPITNAHYEVFVDAEDGYHDPSWWGYSDHAKLWRRKNSQPHEITFEGELLPRTNVTWHEAMAFSIWLTMRLNLSKVSPKRQIILPTEQMWQRASQGNDNRKYPWGNVFDETYSNTKESNLGHPTPVTQYPNGASPAGVMGMSGNIWEWCVSGWNTTPVDIVNSNENLRVLRGGSWIGGQTMAKTNYREKYRPDLRDYFIGFRVACMMVEE